jgi:alkylation response protein AidB-like acyl-CoA dehydrogenase
MTSHLENARDLRSTIDEAARANSDEPTPAAVIEQIRDAGLYSLMCSREVGGAECGVNECLDVFTELAYADGSTGWCVMASNSAASYFSAWSPDSLIERVFGEGIPLIAGQFAPNGILAPDGDDWRCSGDYNFGSGLNDAQWVGAGAFTEPTDGENPDYHFAIVARDEIEILGNWDVMGLRATASWDYRLDDVAIPRDATFSFFDHPRLRGGPIYDLDVIPLTSIGHSGWAIGVVKRAIDELRHTAVTRKRMTGSAPLGQSEYFLIALADAEASFEAARSWVYAAFNAAEAAAIAGTLTPELLLTTRMATTHVNQLGGRIVRDIYNLGGSAALRTGPLERCFRDIHAGTQHAVVSPAVSLEYAGASMQRATEDVNNT